MPKPISADEFPCFEARVKSCKKGIFSGHVAKIRRGKYK
jgi:hypothetical protein